MGVFARHHTDFDDSMATRTDDEVSLGVMFLGVVDAYHAGMVTFFAGEGDAIDIEPRRFRVSKFVMGFVWRYGHEAIVTLKSDLADVFSENGFF